MNSRKIRIATAFAAFLGGGEASGDSVPQPAPEVFIGWTYEATITHVSDGDTLSVALPPSPFRSLEKIRVYGVNSPESTMLKAKCPKEAKLGIIAKQWAREMLPIGNKVKVRIHAKRSYPRSVDDKISEPYGRLIADVILSDGSDYGSKLIKNGLASPYYGTGEKTDWCR